ncbi:hypothetical protein HRI_002644300 [Hibiscus trionum]|uniref:Endonuclease/exonuclease/phosphatase domain-containing protein n=1 Tax=Hibiscus trionum TaxID=183268 RepID=A0A9W7M8W8_HIBTR|nr:hypothetical protein HRI_002644300 [Hibiscus trionum]
MWDPEFFNIEPSHIEPGYIAIEGTISNPNMKCPLINVYAPNLCNKRQELFSDLASIILRVKLPVLIGGDFNIMRCSEEKLGVSIQKNAMVAFSKFINESNLIDLPLKDERFTWSNLRDPLSFSRLD